MNTVLLLVYLVVIFAAAMLGGWLPRRVTMTHTRTQLMMSLVSGLMLGVACFHLIPHSASLAGSIDFTMGWVMAGLVFMLMLLRLFHFHQHDFAGTDLACAATADAHDHAHAHDHSHALPPAGTASWIGLALGLGIHTAIDGVALGAVMQSTEREVALLGLGVFAAITLHKPLDAMSIEAVMAAAGKSSSSRRLANLLFALVCPAAALAFYAGVDLMALGSPVLPAALAFSAGAFMCIALGDLLPEVQFHAHDRGKLTLLFLVGIALAAAIGLLEPAHAH